MPQASMSFAIGGGGAAGDPSITSDSDAAGAASDGDTGNAHSLITNGEVMSFSRICWSVARRAITSAWFAA